MTITIYELLGLIKDGKAPKKIMFNDNLYIFDKTDEDYINEDDYYLFLDSFQNLPTNNILNDTVEIIEKENKIEKLEHYDLFDYFTGYKYGGTDKDLLKDLERNFIHINKELAYLIDKTNKLKEQK